MNTLIFDTYEDERCFKTLEVSRIALSTLDKNKEYSDKAFNQIFGEEEKNRMEMLGIIFKKNEGWVISKW